MMLLVGHSNGHLFGKSEDATANLVVFSPLLKFTSLRHEFEWRKDSYVISVVLQSTYQYIDAPTSATQMLHVKKARSPCDGIPRPTRQFACGN